MMEGEKLVESVALDFATDYAWACSELFGEENVGLLTGDAAVNREAPILIMTTEILRNMLYQRCGVKGNFIFRH